MEPVHPTYTVHYQYDGTVPAGASELPGDVTGKEPGDPITVADPATAPEGYIFVGWVFEDDSLVSDYHSTDVSENSVAFTRIDSFTMPASDVTLIGQFKTKPTPPVPDPTYTVTYKVTSTDPAATAYTLPTDDNAYAEGDTVTVKDVLSVDGYTFKGWTYNGKDYGKDETFKMPADDVELIGVFTKNSDPDPTYTVTYISGLDSSYPGYHESCATPFKDEDVTLDANGKYIVLANDPDSQLNPSFKPDYEFAGWKIAASSGGASPRTNGAAARSGAGTDGIIAAGEKMTLSSNITLQAVWKCNLTYHANGGSPESAVPNSGNAIDRYVDDKVTVEDGSKLTKGDLVFAYWSTTENNATGSQHYNKGDTFTVKKDTDLYAIYKTAPDSTGGKEYTVTYDPNGGTGTTPTDPNKYTGDGTETVTVKDKGNLVRTNCTFKEWNTKKDGSGTGYKGDGTDTFTMPASDVTLYAIWVDSSGQIVPSPGTGESDLPLQIALNLAVISLLAVAFVVMKQQKWRKKNAN